MCTFQSGISCINTHAACTTGQNVNCGDQGQFQLTTTLDQTLSPLYTQHNPGSPTALSTRIFRTSAYTGTDYTWKNLWSPCDVIAGCTYSAVSIPSGAYDPANFVTNSNCDVTWDNSEPFKIQVNFAVNNNFITSATKTWIIEVACGPTSSTLSSGNVNQQYEIQNNFQNCLTFPEFSNTYPNCLITYQVSGVENDFAYVDLSVSGNLAESGQGVTFVSTGTNFEGYNGSYMVCLNNLAYHLKRTFIITIIAQADPNTNFNSPNIFKKDFTLEQYCGVNSGDVLEDLVNTFDPIQLLGVYHQPPYMSFKFTEFKTFAGQYESGVATGCKIIEYTILQNPLDPIQVTFNPTVIPSDDQTNKEFWLPDYTKQMIVQFKIQVDVDGGHTKTFPLVATDYYQAMLACWQSINDIIPPSGYSPTYKYAYINPTVTNIFVDDPSNPITVTSTQNPVPNTHKQRAELQISTWDITEWYQMPFPEFDTTSIFCPLNSVGLRYRVTDNPTDPTVGITNPILLEYVNCVQPCKIVRIKHFHDEIPNLFLPKFYLHVDLPLIDDSDYNMTPYHKFMAIEYNIALVCGDETFINEPENVDLVFKRITSDVKKAEQSLFQDKSPQKLNKIEIITNQFETSLIQCKTHLYELYEDETAVTPYTNPQFTIRDGDKVLTNIKTYDAWYPEPHLIVDDTHPIGEITIYLKGTTAGDIFQIIPLTIWVCGNETQKVVRKEPYDIVIKWDALDYVVEWYELDSTFKFSKNIVSHDLCHNSTVQIFTDECNADKNVTLDCTEEYIFKDESIMYLDNYFRQEQRLMLVGRPNRGTSLARMFVWLQRESHGEIRAKEKVWFTVCGTENVTLINPQREWKYQYEMGSNIPSLSETTFRKWFNTTDQNCPPYQYEFLSPAGNKIHSSVFEFDQKFNINFMYASVGTFQALLHPTSHNLADTVLFELKIVDKTYEKPEFEFPPENKLEVNITHSPNQYTYYTPRLVTKEGYCNQELITNLGCNLIPGFKVQFEECYLKLSIFRLLVKEVDLKQHFCTISIIGEQESQRVDYDVRITLVGKDNSIIGKEFERKIIQKVDSNGTAEFFHMKFIDFKINGTAVFQFSESMIDEDNGFNLTILNQSNMNFTIKLTQDSIDQVSDGEAIKDLIKFKWNATRFIEDKLWINFRFDNPLFFSQGQGAFDILQVEVDNNTFKALNKTNGERIHSNETLFLQQKIKRQLDNSQLSQQLMNSSPQVSSTLNVIGFTQFIVIFTVQLSLNTLFGCVSSIQLTVFTNMCNLQHPPNSFEFYRVVRDVVDFDAFNPEFILDEMDFKFYEEMGEIQLELGEDGILNSNLISNGYDTFNPILSLGGIVSIISLGLFLLFLFGVLSVWLSIIERIKFSWKGKGEWLKSKIKSLREKLFFGFWIRMVMESVFQFTVCILLFNMSFSLSSFKEGNKETGRMLEQNIQNHELSNVNTLSWSLTIFIYIIMIGSIAFVFFAGIYLTYIDKYFLGKEPIKSLFDSMYDNLNINSKANMMFNVVFIGRRILIGAIIIYLQNYSGIQLQLIMFLNILILIYIGNYKPMATRKFNQVELMNEYLVGICNMNMVNFTAYISDSSMKFQAGWVSILILVLMIFLNLLNLLRDICKQVYLQGQQKQNIVVRKYQKSTLFGLKKAKDFSAEKLDNEKPASVNIFKTTFEATERQLKLVSLMLDNYEVLIFETQKKLFEVNQTQCLQQLYPQLVESDSYSQIYFDVSFGEDGQKGDFDYKETQKQRAYYLMQYLQFLTTQFINFSKCSLNKKKTKKSKNFDLFSHQNINLFCSDLKKQIGRKQFPEKNIGLSTQKQVNLLLTEYKDFPEGVEHFKPFHFHFFKIIPNDFMIQEQEQIRLKSQFDLQKFIIGWIERYLPNMPADEELAKLDQICQMAPNKRKEELIKMYQNEMMSGKYHSEAYSLVNQIQLSILEWHKRDLNERNYQIRLHHNRCMKNYSSKDGRLLFRYKVLKELEQIDVSNY